MWPVDPHADCGFEGILSFTAQDHWDGNLAFHYSVHLEMCCSQFDAAGDNWSDFSSSLRRGGPGDRRGEVRGVA